MKNTIFIFIFFFSLLNSSCQNTKNMSNNFTYLTPMLKNADYHNRYIFIDDYVPSVMKRKGFDYVDAHKPSPATDNYFNFENKAINSYHGISELFPKNTTYFRCLYINDTGQIAHTIKKKIAVKELHSSELNIASALIHEGINRLYSRKIIPPEQLFQKITSSEEFTYIYFEKNVDKDIVYEIIISNDTSWDLIYNSLGEEIYPVVPFYRAEFVYDSNGKFIDLKNVK